MSTPVEATDETFHQIIPREGIAAVDMWAEWCGPCKQFAPVYETSAKENPDVVHAKVNIDTNPELPAYFQVQSIPTTIFIRDGIVVGSVSGAMSASALQSAIDQVRELDMESIAANIETN